MKAKEYRRLADGAFDSVYQFKVTLKDIKPVIWRRIVVPGDYSFWDLHVAIQDAMGWLDYHLHAFFVTDPATGRQMEIGIPDDAFGFEDREVVPGWNMAISAFFSTENNRALYLYDFGDDWNHDIRLEKILPRKPNIDYPLCVSGNRACPPEDCGGTWGYADMLNILANPESDEYEQTIEWLGEDFDPDDFDKADIRFSDPKERWRYAFSNE